MNNSVKVLNTYFTVLKNLGHLNYSETLNIFVYIAVKELYDLLNNSTDAELKGFIIHYLNGIKDNSCIIDSSIRNNEKIQMSSDPVFGIVDTSQNSYNNMLIEDLIKALDNLEKKQSVESNLSSDGFTIKIKEPLKSGSLNVFINGVKYFKDLDYKEILNNSGEVDSIIVSTFNVDLNDVIYIEGILIKK